ncbi:DUF4304 domain-containing protein [Streptomyces sp. NPDC048202]|uniref:DUF4304 domain-containing protein n=1 Tax=Streptomyces sp. NPDC048202 TaxID=3365514 RepID=UPI003712877C
MAIRKGVAPELRKLGFVGSGQVFELPDPHVWLLLGIQKSSGSSATRLKFTVNLAAVPKGTWQELLESGANYPSRPSPNKVYGTWAWWSRIGELMPGGQDFWWTVTGDVGHSELAHKVVSACVGYGIPALREQGNLRQ